MCRYIQRQFTHLRHQTEGCKLGFEERRRKTTMEHPALMIGLVSSISLIIVTVVIDSEGIPFLKCKQHFPSVSSMNPFNL